MATQTRMPTVQANDGLPGNIDWELGFGDVFTSDDTFATVALEDTEGSTYLKATGFGFSIPTSATITAIRVLVSRQVNIVGVDYAEIEDYAIVLYRAGTLDEFNGTATGVWTASEAGVEHEMTLGNSWAPADINHANFGVGLSVGASGGIYPTTAQVDFIEIEVEYSDDGGGTSLVLHVESRAVNLAELSHESSDHRFAFYPDPLPDEVILEDFQAAFGYVPTPDWLLEEQATENVTAFVGGAEVVAPIVFVWFAMSQAPQPLVEDAESNVSLVAAPSLVIPGASPCICGGAIRITSRGWGTIRVVPVSDDTWLGVYGTLRVKWDSYGTIRVLKSCVC